MKFAHGYSEEESERFTSIKRTRP